MTTARPFDSYSIRIFGGAEGRVAMILCYQGGSFAGRIDFYPDGAALPDDYLWHPNPSQEYVVLHMPMSRFDAVITTLRYEKPLQLYSYANREIGASTPGDGYLTTTTKEPVGEEESSP